MTGRPQPLLRRALVGFSSPVAYSYDLDRDHGQPNPVLEAPIGLILLYDEIWFASRALCPYNMRGLEFVHYLDEESTDSKLPKDFVAGISEHDRSWDWELWRNVIQACAPGTRLDNHGRTSCYGELPLVPKPNSLENVIVDSFLASVYKFDLVQNSLNADWLRSPGESTPRIMIAEEVVVSNLVNYQTLEGPYHPVLKDLRSDSRVKAFRSRLSEMSVGGIGSVPELSKDIILEYEKEASKAMDQKHGDARLWFTLLSLTTAVIPPLSIANQLLSVKDGVVNLADYSHLREKRNWLDFVGRARVALLENGSSTRPIDRSL